MTKRSYGPGASANLSRLAHQVTDNTPSLFYSFDEFGAAFGFPHSANLLRALIEHCGFPQTVKVFETPASRRLGLPRVETDRWFSVARNRQHYEKLRPHFTSAPSAKAALNRVPEILAGTWPPRREFVRPASIYGANYASYQAPPTYAPPRTNRQAALDPSGLDRFISFEEAMYITALSRPVLLRREHEGSFPKSCRTRNNQMQWRASQIAAWLDAEATAPRASSYSGEHLRGKGKQSVAYSEPAQDQAAAPASAQHELPIKPNGNGEP